MAALPAAARAAGATTSLDADWDPVGAWGADFFPEVLAQADLLLPNEAEALRLAGTTDLPTAIRQLTKAGARSRSVKLGARGALYADGAEETRKTRKSRIAISRRGMTPEWGSRCPPRAVVSLSDTTPHH